MDVVMYAVSTDTRDSSVYPVQASIVGGRAVLSSMAPPATAGYGAMVGAGASDGTVLQTFQGPGVINSAQLALVCYEDGFLSYLVKNPGGIILVQSISSIYGIVPIVNPTLVQVQKGDTLVYKTNKPSATFIWGLTLYSQGV